MQWKGGDGGGGGGGRGDIPLTKVYVIYCEMVKIQMNFADIAHQIESRVEDEYSLLIFNGRLLAILNIYWMRRCRKGR